MDEILIYTDNCLESLEQQIAIETGALIVKRQAEDNWNVNDAMRIISSPNLDLAVINVIDSISLMEISLLNFMCKKILVTTNTVNIYPAVVRTIDFIDTECVLISQTTKFISWFKLWKNGQWN